MLATVVWYSSVIRTCGSLEVHLVRVWHTRALENFAGPFRSGHPLALGWEGRAHQEQVAAALPMHAAGVCSWAAVTKSEQRQSFLQHRGPLSMAITHENRLLQ